MGPALPTQKQFGKVPGIGYRLAMTITAELFGAFLQCPTKCWLKSIREHGTGNAYAEWVEAQNESYRVVGVDRLRSSAMPGDFVTSPPADGLKDAKWRLALDVLVKTADLESRVHGVERVPSEGRGKPAQFIPVRFIVRNKLTKEDKLLLAFDALVLSGLLQRDLGIGRIIHGDEHATLKVKISGLAAEVRKVDEKITALLAKESPPDLILNRHCPECEFQARCKPKAIEKDDLSLLSNMPEKDRKGLLGKGIFTVTQLSYTFKPRRRPKALVGKRERYHHSLKALALRERKIYLVGSPELKTEGTPVYLDVEGIPDRDFYYLIGARVGTVNASIHHSFWADNPADEKTMWGDFVQLPSSLDNPQLIHYGSFETAFLKRMSTRYGLPGDVAAPLKAVDQTVNLLSIIFAQVYFPTYSNGLKDVARFLGFNWSAEGASGLQSIVWRATWEGSRAPAIKDTLIKYNADDCEALEITAQTITRLLPRQAQPGQAGAVPNEDIVRVDDLKPAFASKWRVFSSSIKDLEFVNKAAHWDYQRDRIYVRSSRRLAQARRKARKRSKSLRRVDKTVQCGGSDRCPDCHRKGTKKGPVRSVTLQEIVFGRHSLKRRVVRYQCQPYWCHKCRQVFGLDDHFKKKGQPPRYGRSFLAYLFYQIIDLCIPMGKVLQPLARLFGITLNPGSVASFKESMASYYADTQREIIKRIASGSLVHVDETHVTIKRRRAYVWVLTNMHEVAYVYSDTREGDFLHELLAEFKGVLVSDFFSAYDSFQCPQQRCLIHLVRDLNEELLRSPFDEEFKEITAKFGTLLKSIVEDVDRRGLKKHFLRKHLVAVDRFYRTVIDVKYQSAAAVACQERFRKNRDRLFTFLNYDDIPWNNNNAEHSIKAFARLREFIESGATEKGVREYLVLLSVCQTCKYSGVDFLDFLRSGEKDIEVFAQNGRGRRSERGPALDLQGP